MRKATARGLTLLAVFALAGVGCAHRRPAYEARDLSPSPGVHVRAPFVDVRVKGAAKDRHDHHLSHRDDGGDRLSYENDREDD